MLIVPCFYFLQSATPRDLTRFSPTVDHPVIFEDFRFKGFPDSDFHHAKQPRFREDSAAYRDSEQVDRFFGRPHHFDAGKRVFGMRMKFVSKSPRIGEN